jgi:hypothetical protein
LVCLSALKHLALIHLLQVIEETPVYIERLSLRRGLKVDTAIEGGYGYRAVSIEPYKMLKLCTALHVTGKNAYFCVVLQIQRLALHMGTLR